MARTPTTVRSIQRRLLRILSSADETQLEMGRSWYPTARQFAATLHAEYPQYSYEQVAGVIAVISPQLRWSTNQARARDYINLHAIGVGAKDWTPKLFQGRNMRKAEAVLDGDLTAIVGPKVTAFYANLLGDEDQITIDRWHTFAAIGVNRVPSVRQRRVIQQATLRVAKKMGLTPAALQACVWVVVRGAAE